MKKSHTGTTITFTFDGLAPIVFDTTKAHANVVAHATMHGFEARIGDAAALSRKQKDGTVVTITEAMRRAEVEAMVAHYESGVDQWELRARREPAQNAAILALATAQGKTYAEIEAWLVEQSLNGMTR